MQSKGFTLIELLITIAISVILLMVAVPSMRQFLTASAVEKESDNLFNAFHSARTQAVALNQDIVVCYANSSNVCSTSGFTHLQMFVDKDKDGTLSIGDVVLMTGGTVNNTVSISTPQTNYRFTQEGILRGTGATLTLYNKDYSCTARKVILSVSGYSQICDNSQAGNLGCPTGSYCP